MTTPPPLPPRFERVEEFGDGLLERTFHAHDTVLDRDVLIKLPGKASAGWSAPVRERLLREARALAKVKHEGVAPVLWVEQTETGPLCVFEPPQGELLGERLARGPLDVDETIRLGIDVAEALAAVHYHGVVHRAIGPRSIRLLPDGRAQIASFTFAKEFSGHGQRSSLAHARGGRDGDDLGPHLPDYSAPEQVSGTGSDPRSDIYALGCTLFRCLAGEEAFADGHRHEPMPDLTRRNEDVPKALATVIRTCAMHAKTARYATAREVADALRAIETRAKTGGGSRTGLLVAGIASLSLLAVFGRDLFSNRPNGDRGEPGSQVAVTHPGYDKLYGDTYRRVHGLFVGIGKDYRNWPPLANPVREIHAVADVLRRNDAQWTASQAITFLEDADATANRILEELDRLADRAEEEDAVLIYFAGHGTKHGDSFALCAVDAGKDVELDTGFVRRDALTTRIRRMAAKHVLVILDCCHSGAVFAENNWRGRPLRPRQEDRGADGGRHRRRFSREFLCSTGANQLAADGRSLSPFCKLLLAELDQPADKSAKFIAARYLSARIAQRMDQQSFGAGNLQIAEFKQMSDQQGSFVFRLRRR